ncbi:hypothetical protein QUC31_018530 [Theobroma cacao]|uniref:Uncharacterized protein LOC18590817 isoform X1 n=1 Tax=Theobroma cacao TaxID=3641 RepID=A0AB32WWN3_THECC|nr:PREDICTED: uncharacterized protein LOC18590817 isoform X1 [Theobroma cacao]
MMRPGHLPVSLPQGKVAKKERGASKSRVFPLAEKWTHAIPVVVLLSFFILWWFSRPAVTVEIKDGRIVAIHPVEMPLPLNTSQIELAILASATSPIASVPQNLTGNGTEAHAVSESN